MEKIICAAIWYKDLNQTNIQVDNIDKGVVICGMRHHNCIHIMMELTGLRTVKSEVGEYEQGFLTTKNRFVDRIEGLKIAIRADQLLRKGGSKLKLYSEDLY